MDPDAHLDSTYHPDADSDVDPDSDFLFDENPDADMDPTFHPDTDPDPDSSSKKRLEPVKKCFKRLIFKYILA